MKRALFLDRDGVLNIPILRGGRTYAPVQFSDFQLYEDVIPTLHEVKNRGYLLVLITNQPDLSKGLLAPEELHRMHQFLQEKIPFDSLEVCPHQDSDDCECRKPKPGMILRAAKQLSIDLSQSIVIGDRWRDILAGKTAGCKTALKIVEDFTDDRQETPDWTIFQLQEILKYLK